MHICNNKIKEKKKSPEIQTETARSFFFNLRFVN